MNTSVIEAKNQQVPTARRGFLSKVGAAGAAIAVAAVPAHAVATKPSNTAVELTNRQRMLLKFYDQLSDSVQLTMIDMAEEFANTPTLCAAPQLRVIAGGRA